MDGWHDVTGLEVEEPWVVASIAFAPCYIGGWSAAQHWGLTEQLFRTTFVVSTRARRSSKTILNGSEYLVVRERRRSQAGLLVVWRGSARVQVSGVERTLMDACANPHWVGGAGQLALLFRSAVRDERITPAAMLREAKAASSGAALGRLGLLAERYWAAAGEVVAYARANRRAGKVKLDPRVDARGSLSTAWGVWMNVRLPEADA